MRTKKIFISFTGPDIKQNTKIYNITDGYECWNLKKFNLDDFIVEVKQQIPPINKNVLANYRLENRQKRIDFGIAEEEYKKCSWGLMLPDEVPGTLVNSYAEILFLLNLYSPCFLYPTFYVSNLGIQRIEHKKHPMLYFHGQNQARIFKRKKFVNFFEILLSESIYAAWQADRCAKWDEEDWRLFVVCLLFSELKNYENVKNPFTWQRESADMITILEAMFTAKDEDNTEIIYRLRKRISVLLGFHLSDIESQIKDIYKQRSIFIHGSFFSQIKKQTKVDNGCADLPLPDFDFLKEQKENIRSLLAVYLYINKIRKSDNNEFEGCKHVLGILEQSIIDIGLRSKVKKHAQKIIYLL
jgi:hypothetical protein